MKVGRSMKGVLFSDRISCYNSSVDGPKGGDGEHVDTAVCAGAGASVGGGYRWSRTT